MTCLHLAPFEEEILSKNIRETYRGQAWGDDTGEWVYFDCVFKDLDAVIQRLKLDPNLIKIHSHLGTHSGQEYGLICEACKTGVMGLHPEWIKQNQRKIIEYF
ncbi:MAG: hypothetical protein KDK66_00275 [Deltaproteobacteria bacterium]|nr:hypothetical protein [Deltaproteobacteria bacterium]